MSHTFAEPEVSSETCYAPAPPVAPPDSITVDIYDQLYNLRGTDPAYIAQLAASVDAKMRAVSAQGNTVDSLRVAVLAALNIADELARLRSRHDSLTQSLTQSQNQQQSSVRNRANSLAHLLDEVLDHDLTERKAG